MKKSSGEREYRIIWGFYSGGIGVVVGGWMDGWRKALKIFASRFGFVFPLLILSVAVLKSQEAECILFCNFKFRVCDFGDFGGGGEPSPFIRSTMEEVKFLQKQRERRVRMVANQLAQPLGQAPKVADKGEGEGEKEELVLQDTFAQETAVTVEDPNM
jgi:hypothetical protein